MAPTRRSSSSSSGASAVYENAVQTLDTDVRALQTSMEEYGAKITKKIKTGDDKTGIGAMWERKVVWSPTRIRELEAAVRELQDEQKKKDDKEIKSPIKGKGTVIDTKGRLSALRLAVKELQEKVQITKTKEELNPKKKPDDKKKPGMENKTDARSNNETFHQHSALVQNTEPRSPAAENHDQANDSVHPLVNGMLNAQSSRTSLNIPDSRPATTLSASAALPVSLAYSSPADDSHGTLGKKGKISL